MSQVVEYYTIKARLFCYSGKGMADYAWVNWLTRHTGKNEAV